MKLGIVVTQPKETESASKFSKLPDGKYNVVIEKEEEKTLKTDGSKFLSLTYKIIDGEYKGRFIFQNLFLYHSNPKTASIANEKLHTICWCAGIEGKLNDSSDLLGSLPFSVAVKTTQNGQYENTDVISITRTAPIEAKKEEVKTATATKKPWSK